MKPGIVIEKQVYDKIMHWVNKSKFEVSGLGTVKVEADGTLRVVSAMLLPQRNGEAHTDIEAADVNRALYELRNSEGDLKWWWHSHVKMGVFWSGTDHKTIEEIGSGGWMVATVFNQLDEVKSCFYSRDGQVTPWGVDPLFLDDLSTKIATPLDARIPAWDEEYEKCVQIARPVTDISDRWVGGTSNWMGETRGVGTTSGGPLFDPAVAPPLNRPKGMPKKVFKAWNSAHVQYTAGLQAAQDEVDATKSVPEEETDQYGFDQDERTLLASEGWSMSDIDALYQEDFTPMEMVRMATLSVHPSEVEYLMTTQKYSSEDIMDLVDQSEAFGQNLFSNPSLWRSSSGYSQ